MAKAGGKAETARLKVLMHAGIAAKNMNRKRITPRHILLSVCGDKDLYSLIENIGGRGLIP